MVDIIGLLAFAGFLLVAIGVAISRGDRRRQLVHTFLAYVVVVTFTAGFTHRDLWPFSGWPMMTQPPPAAVGPDLPFSWLYGVTSDGREFPIDYRAWEPLSMSELLAWLEYRSSIVPESRRRRVGAFLLDKANAGRLAVLAGEDPGYLDDRLGPLHAPTHLLFGASWTKPTDVPQTPFVQLRWYREYWNIEQRRADSSRITRVLGFEYP